MSKSHFIPGLRAVEQVLANSKVEIKKIFTEYQTANSRVEILIAKAKQLGINIQTVNRARLEQISGESRHQGIIAEIKRNSVLDEAGLRTLVEQRLTESPQVSLLLLFLDGIQDPHNLGACLRTAQAAGVDAVVVPRHGAAGLGPTVSKVAAGAAETLPFVPVANLSRVLTWLSDYSVLVIGTSNAVEQSLFDCDLSGPVAIVMGSEHSGLRKGIVSCCDKLVSLPMSGEIDSLNISVAAGICLYEVGRQRRL